jgi:hypothetical protein
VRAADGPPGGGAALERRPVERQAGLLERVGHPQPARQPVGPERAERRHPRGAVVVDEVGADVEVLVRVVQGRQLRGGDDPDALPGSGGQRLVHALRGVVVGEREELDAGPGGRADDSRGRQRAI